jgi:hypothetical protein
MESQAIHIIQLLCGPTFRRFRSLMALSGRSRLQFPVFLFERAFLSGRQKLKAFIFFARLVKSAQKKRIEQQPEIAASHGDFLAANLIT